jgi:hypothetical protein
VAALGAALIGALLAVATTRRFEGRVQAPAGA